MKNKRNVLPMDNSFSLKNRELCRDAIRGFSNLPLFKGRYCVQDIDFSVPVTMCELPNYATLAGNRILFAMNELDYLLLPHKEHEYAAFSSRYSDEKIAQAGMGVPYLEKYLFSFLKKEIQLSDNWCIRSVEEYFSSYSRETRLIETLPSAEVVLNSAVSGISACDWLVQLAPELLTKSSPVARYTSGNYGDISSTVFKVSIKELGYGEHNREQSTLFTDTMTSAGLSAEPHKYWQYYLNGSLLLANYYNSITRNRRHFFKYVGALFQAELGLVASYGIRQDALKKALPELNVRYFDEHCHVDIDHSRMIFEGLVRPVIEKYGNVAAKEIVRGFEEARLIAEYAENDFVQQIKWKDNAQVNKEVYRDIWPKVQSAFQSGDIVRDVFDEPTGMDSITYSNDGYKLIHVSSGEVEFVNGFQMSSTLKANDGIIVEPKRLYGAMIRSTSCRYEMYSIDEIKKWL